MSRKHQFTKTGQPRKRKPGAGRPSLGKVKMTVHILPATRKALGDKPGEVLDAHFGGSNRELMDAHYRPKVAAERQPLRATLGSLANDLGVNSRSLRRWLAGEQRPDPCHHRALLNWASLLKKRALAILSHSQKGLKE